MNEGYAYTESIGGRAAGLGVHAYLSARYRHATAAEWLGHIEAGRVLVDGARVRADSVLQPAQVLVWHRPPWEEPDAPLAFEILYDAGGVLVVHKAAGLPTMAGGGFLQHTLVHQLREHHDGAAPMHRLGRWTSGALLCTRNPAAGASVAAQFGARAIYKRYRALASGRPTDDVLEIDAPIGPVPYAPLGTLHAASTQGRPASSRASVIERRDTSFLCDVTIATGRPHQIRIHLAASGHPLVGDPLYVAGGRPAPDGTARPGDPGYHLHSAEIAFAHPETGHRVSVTALPPPVLRLRTGADA